MVVSAPAPIFPIGLDRRTLAAAPRETQAMLPPLCNILQIHLGVSPFQLKYKCTPPLSIFHSELSLSRVSDTTGSGQTPNSYFKSWW